VESEQGALEIALLATHFKDRSLNVGDNPTPTPKPLMVEPMDSVEPVDLVEPMDSVELVDLVELIDLVEPVDSVELIDLVDSSTATRLLKQLYSF
jgi:hypothetical protein